MGCLLNNSCPSLNADFVIFLLILLSEGQDFAKKKKIMGNISSPFISGFETHPSETQGQRKTISNQHRGVQAGRRAVCASTVLWLKNK